MPYAEYHRKQKERERTIKRREYFKEYRREHPSKNSYKYMKLSPEEIIERRKEFGESRRGEGNPMFGRIGKDHPSFGKKRPDVAERIRRLTREEHPFFGKNHSQKSKDKMRIAQLGKKNPIRAELNRQQVGEKNPAYIDGRSYEPYTLEFNRQLKELIRSRDGHKCQKCGCPEIKEAKKLSIHHIDYNKKNCLSSNLIALCRKCNAIVNTKRKKWTKYFQKKMAIGYEQSQLCLSIL